MKKQTNKYLIVALLFGLLFHGTAIFFTLEKTYDALIHLFFAEHYSTSWFEPWNYKWYTGFTVMSYPPLVHQFIGLFSFVAGLKFGLFVVAFIAIILFITGSYRFSLLITASRKAAGYAAILAVFSSTFIETLHLFGQLPSIIGASLLMHSMPEIYLWLKTGKYKYLVSSLALMAVMVCSHHVTPIFGMVFFIFPLIGLAILDTAKDQVGSFEKVTFRLFLQTLFKLFRRILSFGLSSLFLIVFCILPYWINTKNNPITQIPIPHGSRDNFLEVTSSGLVFFLIPWGILLAILPYVFYRYYSKRYICFGISITVLTILGTGGTTPIPKLFLGENAFNILTLDRFTLWASLMSMPLFGEFSYRLAEGDLKELMQNKFGAVYHRLFGALLVSFYIFMAIFTLNMGYFRPSQPQKIKTLPIVNFLNQDQHDKWRYLTLGFGDQMAWLGANTKALSVDGNYHSARRLPELTTRAIERLENSKFKGIEGLGSLQQFLTVPEKYNLKYIFSNDKFYDPILYFCGWQRLQQLENGIMVWEKLNVPPIASILQQDEIATFQKVMWGLIPVSTVLIVLLVNLRMIWRRTLKTKIAEIPNYQNYEIEYLKFPSIIIKIIHVWIAFLILCASYGFYLFYVKNISHQSPENIVKAYYNALDFKEYEKAHSLVDPNNKIKIAQFMLELSVRDGILGSYAKLDSIAVSISYKNDSTAHARVYTEWITPLEKLSRKTDHDLVAHGKKWFVKLKKTDSDLPPNQLYVSNSTQYFNHGRRKITTEQTHHEDVLKRPVLEILSSKLVKFNNSYALIGEVQNIDNVPADVILKGTLYNDDNLELATYNCKHSTKHKLMPKEITSFKINFEGIAWSKTKDSIPKTFNPDEFTPIELSHQPTKFNLQAIGSVTTTNLYKNTVVNQLKVRENDVSGFLFNNGIQEVTIPQLLISYYNENRDIIWVDHLFLEEGVRQERKRYFNYTLKDFAILETINTSMENCFVNGFPNATIASAVVPDRIQKHGTQKLQSIQNNMACYIKVEINNFIGNPK
ncbi:hypothetical protein [Flavicella sediminum]|uniref:hypothetical protein n=1 Tax=Flavicella sediminum TaxID=2585141 RepID=UPI001120D634|nr:hypothetical protein [Flavicella sediminum]